MSSALFPLRERYQRFAAGTTVPWGQVFDGHLDQVFRATVHHLRLERLSIWCRPHCDAPITCLAAYGPGFGGSGAGAVHDFGAMTLADYMKTRSASFVRLTGDACESGATGFAALDRQIGADQQAQDDTSGDVGAPVALLAGIFADANLIGFAVLERAMANEWKVEDKLAAGLIAETISLSMIGLESDAANQHVQHLYLRYRALYESAAEPLFQLTAGGWIVACNSAFALLLGFPNAEALIESVRGVLRNVFVEPDLFDIHLGTVLKSDCAPRLAVFDVLRGDGELAWVRFTLRPVLGPDGRVARLDGSAADVSGASGVEIGQFAYHDRLTGLPNGRCFADRLSLCLARQRAGRAGAGVIAVILVEIDNLSLVTDSLGQDGAETVLTAVAHRIRAIVPPGTMVSRRGDHQFALLLNGPYCDGWLVGLGNRTRAAIAEAIAHRDSAIYVTASAGIATHGPDSADPSHMVRDAEAALHQAMAAGGARTILFEDRIRLEGRLELQLRTDMREGLRRGQFRMVYQPIYITASRELAGFESLCRWGHPEFGEIPPNRFIDVAEKSDFVADLGSWILETTFLQAAQWSRNGNGPYVTVNVSPVQLLRPEFLSQFKTVLQQSGCDPKKIVVELTESVLVEGVEAIGETLCQIRQTGARIFIDDFGTGYSSLSRLYRLPIDGVKIDRAFVQPLRSDPQSAKIVGAVIGLARSLGIQTVAEGVEGEAELAILRSLGCTLVQGFLFSKPLESDAAQALLERTGSGEQPDPSRTPSRLIPPLGEGNGTPV